MDYGLILLSAPPQTGKSLTITESFQAWILTKYPTLGVLTLGYATDFAKRFGRRNKEKFEEFTHKLTHGKVKLHDKMQNQSEWEVMILDKMTRLYHSSHGSMSSAGLRGVVTGKTGNVIIIDDPIKNMKDALSEIMVQDNKEAFQSTVETRLLGNPGALCIVMATRWVPGDLIGWLRKHRKQYIIGDYNYAALCTEENAHKDPLKRTPGQGICPEMGNGDQWAQSIKQSYEAGEGSHVFSAMFQGEPSNELGNLFKKENWREYRLKDHWPTAEMEPDPAERQLKLRQFDRIFLSIDATFKDLTTSDFVAMELTGIKNGNTFMRYLVRKQMDFPDTIDKILKICKMFPEIDVIYIEDKANGPGIVSVIKKWRKKLDIDEDNFPSVVPINPEGGKYSRAQTAAVYQRDGYSHIPAEPDAHLVSCEDDFVWDDDSSYVHAYKQELGTFPYGANDDLVDCYSQGVIKNIGLITGEEIVERQERSFARFSNWWPEMWEDYNNIPDQKTKNKFIREHGAPIEWQRKGERA